MKKPKNDDSQIVPDTALTYERAKPASESPSGSLKQPATTKPKQPDSLNDNANPRGHGGSPAEGS